MLNNYEQVIAVLSGLVMGLLVFVGVLLYGNTKTDEVLSIGDCIHEKSEAEGFPGEYKEAWVIYYDVCSQS